MILVPNVQQMIIPLEQVIFQNGILYFKTVMADWGITGLFNGKIFTKNHKYKIWGLFIKEDDY